jgi:hypothetical protein
MTGYWYLTYVNQNEEVPDSLGGLGSPLAEYLKK